MEDEDRLRTYAVDERKDAKKYVGVAPWAIEDAMQHIYQARDAIARSGERDNYAIAYKAGYTNSAIILDRAIEQIKSKLGWMANRKEQGYQVNIADEMGELRQLCVELYAVACLPFPAATEQQRDQIENAKREFQRQHERYLDGILKATGRA